MNQVRCEWGADGIGALSGWADVFVIVDVLSFTTCVDIAVARGAAVLPFDVADRAAAAAHAARHGARLALRRAEAGPDDISLKPGSLMRLHPGDHVVLPSPNGATLSRLTGATPTFAACLRNAAAVAGAVAARGGRIAVIPAGERWPGGTLRPAIEDWLGAGAVIAGLDGPLSAEATMARDAHRAHREELAALVAASVSGRELADLGHPDDVTLAVAAGVSDTVPMMTDGAYRSL